MTAVPDGPPTGRARPRVVASDLDGTLVRSDGTISARSRLALEGAERAGALVVFVTGRPPRWMQPVIEQTGASGLAICANGALVYDLGSGQIVREHALSPEIAGQLVDSIREALPGVSFAVENGLQFGHEPDYVPGWPAPERIVADGRRADRRAGGEAAREASRPATGRDLRPGCPVGRGDGDGDVQRRRAAGGLRCGREQGLHAGGSVRIEGIRRGRRDRVRRHAQRHPDAALGGPRDSGRQRPSRGAGSRRRDHREQRRGRRREGPRGSLWPDLRGTVCHKG